LLCPICAGKWQAEHGRRRRAGRIVIRALTAFEEAGGNPADMEKLRITALGKDLFEIDPLGYLAGVANTADEVIELTSELLDDAIRLSHPDCHPPERQDLARCTTQKLLALKPFTFPAPQPKNQYRATNPSTREPRRRKRRYGHRTLARNAHRRSLTIIARNAKPNGTSDKRRNA
jgi:hypothetical protein